MSNPILRTRGGNGLIAIVVVGQFEIRRRRSLISAQRLERSDNLGINAIKRTPEPCKGFKRGEPFQGLNRRLHS